MITVKLSRCSVHAADEPRAVEFKVSEETTVSGLISEIIEMKYLASIHGGEATWSLVSTQPLAVIAQQWAEPKLLSWASFHPEVHALAGESKVLPLHLNYHAQQDPDIVYNVLRRFKLGHS